MMNISGGELPGARPSAAEGGKRSMAVGQMAKQAVAAARADSAELPKNAQGLAASAIARGADPASIFTALVAPPAVEVPPDSEEPVIAGDTPPGADEPPLADDPRPVVDDPAPVEPVDVAPVNDAGPQVEGGGAVANTDDVAEVPMAELFDLVVDVDPTELGK
ncbi:MAG: hypothetical protein GKR98_06205 [Boseongicola sp.]|nr:MAG: hypothetical protein GKR98_06205 [Boseongicola sp.]